MPECPSCRYSFETEHGLRIHHSVIHGKRLDGRDNGMRPGRYKPVKTIQLTGERVGEFEACRQILPTTTATG